MKPSESFKAIIKNYLDERAKSDELFAVSYAKEKKNVEECCEYIMGEAKKRGNAVAMTDDEVYGLAVHYYDEDDIKITKVSGGAGVSAPAPKVKLTEEDKKAAHAAAIKQLTEEQYQSLRKKPSKKKGDTEIKQMSLF